MAQNLHFAEDQRWPSRPERFGWLVAIGVAMFVVFELRLLAAEPAIASAILLFLLGLFLMAITVRQRPSVFPVGMQRDAVVIVLASG